MRHVDTAVRDTGQANRQAESILGQFYCAFAQGAGTMRIRRDAIVALRARYFGPIEASATSWDGLASNVLPLLAQVGRLAALLATQNGHTAIAETDFTRARQIVEAGAHSSSGLLIAGPMCPPVAGEADHASEVPGSGGRPAGSAVTFSGTISATHASSRTH